MRKLFTVTLPLLAALLTTTPSAAQDAPVRSLETRISNIIEQSLDEIDSGAIVLVDVGGERTIVTSGLANRETGLAMDAGQMMRSASIGKLYTAAVIHRLILNGQIDLNQTASTYLAVETISGIANADITIVCQAPRLAPYLDMMRELLARTCKIDPNALNIKATTTEKMG